MGYLRIEIKKKENIFLLETMILLIWFLFFLELNK